MAINHDFVQGPPNSTGAKIDNVLVDTDKERQVASIGGPQSTDKDSIAEVVAASPAGTEYGLVVRNIPSGIQPVSGTVTANAGTNLNTSALSLEATQALVKAKTDNLDVALSTRLKPADTLAAVTTVATVTSITNVVHVDDNAASLTVDTPQLPAVLDASGFLKTHEQGTAAVSVASLPLPTGAALEAGNLLTTTGYLSQMLENQRQEIKLLKAVLLTLGNMGSGPVDPEEAAEITALVN